MKRFFLLGYLIYILQCSALAADVAINPGAAHQEGAITEVDYHQVWESLKKSSIVWPQIIDNNVKLKIVLDYIQIYKQQGVKITNSPLHYAKRVDEIYKENPKLFSNPFDILIQNIAIMDYDFDNRQDKDKLARKLLGQEGYLANKKRLNIK